MSRRLGQVDGFESLHLNFRLVNTEIICDTVRKVRKDLSLRDGMIEDELVVERIVEADLDQCRVRRLRGRTARGSNDQGLVGWDRRRARLGL